MRRRNGEQGSALILGLGLMAGLLIPLVGILTFASRSTTASVTANGLATISANAAATRAVDQSASGRQGQIQLFTPGTVQAQDASNDVNAVVSSAWQYSSAGSSTGGTLSMQTTNSGPSGITTPGGQGDSSSHLVMGIVNLSGSPSDNYAAAQSNELSNGNGCRSSSGYLKDPINGNTVCWVDHKAVNYPDWTTSSNRNPMGWTRQGSQQWDHYTSGVETLLKLDMGAPWPFNNTGPIVSTFPGVATFSQNCEGAIGAKVYCHQ